jgi:hypothetical protein
VLVRRGTRPRLRGARDPQRQAGVVDRAQPRQQPVALRHQRRGRRVDGPAVGRGEPAHDLQQRRLPAAARPDDRDRLARARAQRDVLERRHGPERLADPRQHHVAGGP